MIFCLIKKASKFWFRLAVSEILNIKYVLRIIIALKNDFILKLKLNFKY